MLATKLQGSYIVDISNMCLRMVLAKQIRAAIAATGVR